MAEAMSDERLADIRAQVSEGAKASDVREQWAWGIAAELLAEVERLNSARDSAVRAWKQEHDAADELQRERDEARIEADQLRTELQAKLPGRGFLAQAYANGWHEAIAAYRAPGWAEREAGWKKYLAEVDADGPWIVSQQASQSAAAEQQPEDGDRG